MPQVREGGEEPELRSSIGLRSNAATLSKKQNGAVRLLDNINQTFFQALVPLNHQFLESSMHEQSHKKQQQTTSACIPVCLSTAVQTSLKLKCVNASRIDEGSFYGEFEPLI